MQSAVLSTRQGRSRQPVTTETGAQRQENKAFAWLITPWRPGPAAGSREQGAGSRKQEAGLHKSAGAIAGSLELGHSGGVKHHPPLVLHCIFERLMA